MADPGRPAFYALPPGGWRDYWTLLHPPYTLWHLSFVAIGAALAPAISWRWLAESLIAFFLAIGLAAHALDEVHDRPLRTRITAGKEFCQLSGEDVTVAAFLAQGGEGCISVTSNVAPKLCAELHAAWRERDVDTFNRIRDRLTPLHDAMFCEPSPAPAKFGASLLAKSSPDVRLPLVNLTPAGQARVRDAMVHCGLIN